MKVTFGKRAFLKTAIKREMISGHNVKSYNFKLNGKLYKCIYYGIFISLMLLLYYYNKSAFRAGLNRSYLLKYLLIYILASPLTFTLHELFHVLAAELYGIKGLELHFLPYGMKSSVCVSYDEMPILIPHRILFVLIPFFMMTVLPAFVSVFLPQLRFELIEFSILAAFGFLYDLSYTIIMLLNKPKGICFNTGDVFIIPQSEDSTVAQIAVNNEEKLIVREWKINGSKLTEIEPDISGSVAGCVAQIEKERAEGAWWVSKK